MTESRTNPTFVSPGPSAGPPPGTDAGEDPPTPGGPPGEGSGRRASRWGIAAVAAGVVAVGAAAIAVAWPGDDGDWQTADVSEPTDVEEIYAESGARLERRDDGVRIEIDVPTPEPGSYEYATRDMIPPWVENHPPVSPGAGDAPETFTLWLFAFNDPSRCTDGACDSDDVGVDTDARGGVYQADGRVATEDDLRFAGNVRLGQQPLDGAALDNPIGAEVHVAIASHGRALSGPDGVIQLNTPIGNPSLWWGARFPAP